MQRTFRLFLTLCVVASAAFAAPEATPKLPPELVSPLEAVQTLQGAMTVLGDGRTFAVTLEKPGRRGFYRFDVELESRTGPVLDFRVEAGEIHYWRGHLVVVAPKERKALHFSMKDSVRPVRMADSPPVSAAEVAELDSLLRSKYELTRLDQAVALSSVGGPRAWEAGRELRSRIAPMDTEYQDPGGSGGLGTCGASCTTRCGDGSSCSTNCIAPRCASCTCPASCSCK